MDVPALPRWLGRLFPAGMRRRMIDVGDAQHMHVVEWGEPRAPAVLLVHGNPTWSLLYRKVVDELVARGVRLRLVAPDLIGLGLSSKPRDAALHTLVNHGRWLGRAIDALGLERITFVGQDWGGPIGLSALADRLDGTSAMVLLNTVVGPPRAGFRPTVFHRFARMPVVSDLAFRLGGFPLPTMPLAQGDRASLLGMNLLGYAWPLRRIRDRVAPLALARMVPDGPDHPSLPELARCQEAVLRFAGPIAIVWGDRDPVLGRVVGHLERLLPHAEVTHTRAGHFLQEEVPGPIADAILAAWARAEAN